MCSEEVCERFFDRFVNCNNRRIEAYKQEDWKKYEMVIKETHILKSKITKRVMKEIRQELNIEKQDMALS